MSGDGRDGLAEDAFAKLGRALDRFGEAVSLSDPSDLERDGAIQRFEFCYELTWKALKAALSEGGLPGTGSPRAIFHFAYNAGWIDDEQVFRDMMDDRNLTSHTYKEEIAEVVFSRLPGYYEALRKLHDFRDTFR